MGEEENTHDQQEDHAEQDDSNLEDLFDLTENTRGLTSTEREKNNKQNE